MLTYMPWSLWEFSCVNLSLVSELSCPLIKLPNVIAAWLAVLVISLSPLVYTVHIFYVNTFRLTWLGLWYSGWSKCYIWSLIFLFNVHLKGDNFRFLRDYKNVEWKDDYFAGGRCCFFLRFIFVYEYFVWMYLCLSPVSLVHEKVRRGTWIPGTRVIEYCEPPCACSELNPGALQKLQVLLTAAPSVSLVG